MEIKPTYVTFEQAKLLKEKGFDVPTVKFYYLNDKRKWYKDGELGEGFDDDYWGKNTNLNWNKDGKLPFKSFSDCVSAPEQWQVVEWLRVKYNHYTVALPLQEGKWVYSIYNILKPFLLHKEEMKKSYNSPQEAYSAAFDYVLKNLTL